MTLLKVLVVKLLVLATRNWVERWGLRTKRLLMAPVILLSSYAHAFTISDVINVNRVLEHEWHTFDFNLTNRGYNYLTDTINYVELSYDFSQMVDEQDDYDFPETLETVQMNSYIFDGRMLIYNLDPEVFSQRLYWQKNESACQKENYDTGECEFNLDLYGTARESLNIYNGNVWLGEVRFTVDVTRANVPEPSALMLTALGLFAIFLGVRFRNREE